MPPILLPEFPEKPKPEEVYKSLLDGQCWKVSPEDYDYETSEMKAFLASLKNAASKLGCYVRTFVTADDHVILQKRPDDYRPTKGYKRKPKES